MVTALNFDLLKKKIEERYDCDERRIVGIIIARYGTELTEKVVGECYLYWNKNTNTQLDVYWAGYGEYLMPNDQDCNKKILDFSGNDNRVYFDLDAFICIKNKLNDSIREKCTDGMELVLANYYNGELHLSEAFKISLGNDLIEIKENMEWITNECMSEYDVKSLLNKWKWKKTLRKIKGITLSDMLTALGFMIR